MRLSRTVAVAIAQRQTRFHVEPSDVESYVLGELTLRLLRGGKLGRIQSIVTDYLRNVGGREQEQPHSWGYRFLHEQFGKDYDAPVDCDYVARLALKRCGVLMLECLPKKLRRLMILRYWHDLSQLETGRLLGYAIVNGRSCPRVSQLELLACKMIAKELERRGIKSMRDLV